MERPAGERAVLTRHPDHQVGVVDVAVVGEEPSHAPAHLLGAGFSLLSAKQYTAESRVSVAPTFDAGAGTTEEVNIDTERGIAQSSAVATLAQAALGSNTSPSDLLDRVSVDPVGESTILAIRYTHTDPAAAYRGADAFAQAYLDFRASQADEATRQARNLLADEKATKHDL